MRTLTPGVEGKFITTSHFGKLPRMHVNRITNGRAKRTITSLALPQKVMHAQDFMNHALPKAHRRLDEGAHGSAFSVMMTPETLGPLKRIFNALDNAILVKKLDRVPLGAKLVVKVMTLDRAEREFWNDTKAKERYFKDVSLTMVSNAFKGKPEIPYSAFDAQYKKTKSHFEGLSPSKQREILGNIPRRQKELWKELLHKGAVDATNHEYLMTAPPVDVSCGEGTITLHARDVVPEFYFAGSHRECGVYVIVMGLVDGRTYTPRSMTPPIVASFEKALLTLSVVGVDHGDMHTGNIMAKSDGSVKLIDFGMTAILPKTYRDYAFKAVSNAVQTLLRTGRWPEEVTNAIWYNGNKGTMRYMNSYMQERHGNNFNWWNPGAKMLLYTKASVTKGPLDDARIKLWRPLCKGGQKRHLNDLLPDQKKKVRYELNYSEL